MLNVWKGGQGCPKSTEGSGGCGCTLPLCNAGAGKRFKVAKISGGRRLCARMASMGIYPGVEMELVCSGCGCPCLVRINGGTISLGEGISDKILVTANI